MTEQAQSAVVEFNARPVNPAVPDPEVVAMAKRRRFSTADKRRILKAADGCSALGELGALLRREGIYSSYLTAWRKKRAVAENAALAPKRRGRKPDAEAARNRQLEALAKENERLRKQLSQAETIIEVQKKLCDLLGLPSAEAPNEKAK